MAISAQQVASVIGIETVFRDLRNSNILFKPQMIALVGQGSSSAVYSLDKKRVTTAIEVGETYGFGSPVHLAAQQLFPVNGDGVGIIPVTVYPLEDDGSGVAAAGDITPSGAQTVAASYQIKINNILSESFVINIGASVSAITAAITTAINSNINMPVVAVDNGTDVGLTVKWAGTSGNDVFVEIVESNAGGTIFTITQPTGGLVNPSVQPALDLFGEAWESLVVNCLEYNDTSAFDEYQAFGEGRWEATIHKQMIVATGNTIVDPTTASAISEARRETDRVNGYVCAPGSKNLPCQIAARGVARVAPIADSNPARGYQSQNLSGITPGLDSEQWTNAQRDLAVKRGCSTVEVVNGVLKISDLVTFWHPASEAIPAYRYWVNIVKLMQVTFNTIIPFEQDTWKGAPLIPDGQYTVEPYAKRPSMAKAEIAAVIDGLAAYAIISDPETAKETIVALIDSMNPNRLNASWVCQLSGNANVISLQNNFGFFFGQAQAIEG